MKAVQNSSHTTYDESQIIDADGYRLNVGIVLLNQQGKVFWGRGVSRRFWQFPQGGVSPGETSEQAMFRELHEEVGLEPEHVKVLGCTERWLHYDLPERYVRRNQTPLCIGQKQRWYGLRLIAGDDALRFDATNEPEFDSYRWINYWKPASEVVSFKRGVYRKALNELASCCFPHGVPRKPPEMRRSRFGPMRRR